MSADPRPAGEFFDLSKLKNLAAAIFSRSFAEINKFSRLDSHRPTVDSHSCFIFINDKIKLLLTLLLFKVAP